MVTLHRLFLQKPHWLDAVRRSTPLSCPFLQEDLLLKPILGALCHLLIQNMFYRPLSQVFGSVIAFARAAEKSSLSPIIKIKVSDCSEIQGQMFPIIPTSSGQPM